VRVFFPRLGRAELIRRLREHMVLLDQVLPLLQVVLFGSYARGDYTVSSDVDLLVVYRGQPREDAFALTKKALDVPGLEPHVYAEGEFERAKDRIQRMTQGVVVLFSSMSKCNAP